MNETNDTKDMKDTNDMNQTNDTKDMKGTNDMNDTSSTKETNDCNSLQNMRRIRLTDRPLSESTMPIRPAPSMPAPLFAVKHIAAACGLVVLAGCAQQQEPGYYTPQRGSSITDSQYTGEGAQYRSVVRAPSQVQISLDRDARQANPQAADSQAQPQGPLPASAAATGAVAQAQPVAASQAAGSAGGSTGGAANNPALASFAPQPQTYAGTLPCLAPGMNCSGQKMVLTLASNGRWRARLAFVDMAGATGKPTVEQGCWDATTARPIRLLLTDLKGNTRADFESLGNTLRVRSMDGQTPNLNYSLTRQPDLDPISELSSAAAPNCG